MQRARYADRRDAGRVLAGALTGRADAGALVLGLPRGGIPVAAEVARALGAELDVLVVRKLGVPAQPELAMGALAAVGDRVETVWVPAVRERLDPDPAAVAAVRDRELAELRRRAEAYRGARPAPVVAGRHVVLVDDGLATGASMRVAVTAVRANGPARLTVAVPVGPRSALAELAGAVDDLECPLAPTGFRSVGQAYDDFSETSDEEVLEALRRGGSVG
ncbi:phosphoribosyltransferase family protein [Blastococcus sp. BMG 814]|uniref:Phosphoribosyltransferase family protein n=1 Tax=Blastococcus carthaginiensis TaxID=3050034 RepID=A0ABT9I770_9ACTN|nr:phosphoribosyltransferase family protein [Blastococcus carthaginiensis]MDP5181416.1 phosphoribosyltransferase family protein [Blastococcus carthaginiensis]